MVYVWKQGEDGAAIERGQIGHFDYTGILAKDGKQFDSSREETRIPLETPLQVAAMGIRHGRQSL